MDNQPKTRRETKKDPRQKSKGDNIYSSKHIRLKEALLSKPKPSPAVPGNKSK